ncbi:glutathione S-transferase N-terminal domain-containing protein [Caenibius sp. WL]|uniref:glutathione S-transferase family protein n=1 Tax=Caenibius sp. WL TaxID=2872646 RepID=UPI001C996706|nr:glutathione S-transferase N-terminal domain-containing protein [Caenibius sp. WL]QZP09523.1 glutathione S-transferase N-terminal domain-containing protein [Caenibius sp. WL]
MTGASTVKLYGMASPNVRKITIMLAELKQAYSFHHINVFRGEQFTPKFRQRNPNGKVPVLVYQTEENGPETIIFESAAILIHLAERFGRFLPNREPMRSAVMQWLMIQACNIGPLLGQLNHFTFAARQDNDYAFARYRREAERLYRLLDERLAQTRYLGGDEYSIADIATYPWSLYLEQHGFAPDQFAHLGAWRQQVARRPGVIQGMQAVAESEAIDTFAFETASPRDRDRFFGMTTPFGK